MDVVEQQTLATTASTAGGVSCRPPPHDRRSVCVFTEKIEESNKKAHTDIMFEMSNSTQQAIKEAANIAKSAAGSAIAALVNDMNSLKTQFNSLKTQVEKIPKTEEKLTKELNKKVGTADIKAS